MTSRGLLEALDHVHDVFTGAVEEQGIERDFSANVGESTLQMRKACRAIELASFILDRFGHEEKHFAAVIELCFQAIERSCQAALVMCGRIKDIHRMSHGDTLEDSHLAALWDDAFATALRTLHKDYRTLHYYDRGVPSIDKASAMLRLARKLHEEIEQSNLPEHDDCICPR